ncbi:MAG: HEAT repeat domain-containing protein [Vicinamibacteria bacterium]
MRRLLANLGLSLVSLGLFVAVIEGGARLVESRRPAAPPRADYIWDWQQQWEDDFYTLASDEAGWPPGAEINGDGFRDRTHPGEKTAGVARIAFLGDSVTFGHGLEPAQAFPRVLQSLYDREGAPVEVMSFALWGYSTRQERYAYERVARRYRPDRVLVAICLNDIPEVKNNLTRPPAWLSVLHARSAAVRLLVGAQSREIHDVEELFTRSDAPQVREGFELFFRELGLLRDAVRADGGELGLAVFPFRFQMAAGAPPPLAQRTILDWCAREKLPCLDLLPALAPLGEAAFLDYDHLSAEGARLTAEALRRSALLPAAGGARQRLEPWLLERGASGARAAAWLAAPEQEAGALVVATLREALGAAEPEQRAAAAFALGKAAAARQAAEAGREAAARAASDGDAAAGVVDDLSRLLREDPSDLVRVAAARALGEHGPVAAGAPGARAKAAAASAVPALLEALRAPREPLRFAAADALHRIGVGPGEADALVAELKSRDRYVRAFASWSLGQMGAAAGAAAAAALAEELRQGGGAGRAGAARSLARMGPAAAAAVPALLAELREADPGRRWRAARTLGRIGPAAASAVPALAETLGDADKDVRVQAARALGRIGESSRPAIPALVAALRDPEREVREEASRTLSLIPGR